MVVRFDRTHLSRAESRSLGRHLAEARRAAGMSESALARRLNLPEAKVRAYEAGRARFPVRLIFAAARALGVTPYQLLAGRSDRVVNPWEPSAVEWMRLRRRPTPPLDASPREGEVVEGPKAGGAAETGGEGAQESFEALTGEEAERALRFLDEPDPSVRRDEVDDW